METHVQLKERDSYAGVGGHIFLPYCTVLQWLHHDAGCNFVSTTKDIQQQTPFYQHLRINEINCCLTSLTEKHNLW